jgi:hypothetical protein
MEILLAIAVAAVVAALVYFNRSAKSLDVNNDGKIDADDVKAAVQNVVEGVKAVDVAEVKAAVQKTKAKTKATVQKVTSNRGRKPRSKT